MTATAIEAGTLSTTTPNSRELSPKQWHDLRSKLDLLLQQGRGNLWERIDICNTLSECPRYQRELDVSNADQAFDVLGEIYLCDTAIGHPSLLRDMFNAFPRERWESTALSVLCDEFRAVVAKREKATEEEDKPRVTRHAATMRELEQVRRERDMLKMQLEGLQRQFDILQARCEEQSRVIAILQPK